MIYIASPYTHKEHQIMQQRFEQVARYCGQLMLEGLVVYSPITHNHPIAILIDLPRTWDWWKKFDEHILKRCDSMRVLTLEGWSLSVGVMAEIEIAKQNNIPTTYHSL